MTYGEVKQQIRDYGFDDDTTMSEYATIVKNAVNDALQLIFDTVVQQLIPYYKRTLSTEEQEWSPVRPDYITDSTPDATTMALPDNIIQLVPLLAAYFVWLDDDVQKSTYYWNTYDSMKQEIMDACYSTVKGKITGGIGW